MKEGSFLSPGFFDHFYRIFEFNMLGEKLGNHGILGLELAQRSADR